MRDTIIHVAAEGPCEACGRPFRLMGTRALDHWERRLCALCLQEARETWVSIYARGEESGDLCGHVLAWLSATEGEDLARELVMDGWRLQERSGSVLGLFRCGVCGRSWPSESDEATAAEPPRGRRGVVALPARQIVVAVALVVLMALSALLGFSPFFEWRR